MAVRPLELASGVSLALSVLLVASGCGSSDTKALIGSGSGGGSGAPGDAGLDGASAAGSSGSGGATSSGGAGATGAGGATTASGGATTGNGGAQSTGGTTGLVDAGGGCNVSADCAGTADCIGGACVPYVACKNSLDCKSTEVCSPTSHRCSECASTADCTGGQECIGSKCVTVTACTSDKQCTPLGQLCDTKLGRCADCLSTADCTSGLACVGGACTPTLCTPSKAYCDGSTVKTCDVTGQTSVVTKTCTAGQFCDPKTVTCVAQVCAPGAAACDGTRATKCNAQGTGYDVGGTDCATSKQSCVAGACKACSGGATASASVRMVEVMVGTPEYVVLENTSGCSVNLNGLTMSFLTSTSGGVTADLALPSQTLAAGEKVYVIDGTAGPSIDATDIPTAANINWQATYGGAVLLCTGPCSGGTVLDALSFQGGSAAPALPSPVTFTPVLTTLTTSNEQTDSFHRSAFTGASPTFKPSDWGVAAATRPGAASAVTTCPATQPVNASSCINYIALAGSCPYGAVTCTCGFGSFTWSCQ